MGKSVLRSILSYGAVMAVLATPWQANGQLEVYGFDSSGTGGLCSFSKDDPTDLAFIRPYHYFYCLGFDSDGSTLRAVDWLSKTIGEVERSTGIYTPGPTLNGDLNTSQRVYGLAEDPVASQHFVTTGTQLYTIDVNSGATTLVTTYFGTDPNTGEAIGTVVDLAIDGSGQVYVVDMDVDALWVVDKSTGECTLLGKNNADANAEMGQSLAYDHVTGILYGFTFELLGFQLAGTYGTWDTSTGAYTELADARTGFNFPVILEIAVHDGTGFAFNELSNARGIGSFTAGAPSDFAMISTFPNDSVFTAAMDFDATGTLYAVHPGNGKFGTVDLTRGTINEIAVVNGDYIPGFGMAGLSYDQSTDTFYFCNRQSLFTIDPSDASTAFIGHFDSDQDSPVIGDVLDIAIDSTGKLYAIDDLSNGLWQIDKDSGAATLVGQSPFEMSLIQGMDFDPSTDRLYHMQSTLGGGGSYGTWNLSTGSFEEIVPFSEIPDPDGDGFVLKMAVVPTGSFQLSPATVSVTEGDLRSGDSFSVSASDNVDLSASRNPQQVQATIEVELSAVAPRVVTAADLTFTVESSVFARGPTSQTIELFDFSNEIWEVVDQRNASRFSDRTDTVLPGGDVSRFVDELTGEMRARVCYRANASRAQFSANVDHVYWTLDD